MTDTSKASDALPERNRMKNTSTIALAVAGLWIISLLTLLIDFSGAQLFFRAISLGTSILAGIGMLALVWIFSGPPSEEQQTIPMVVGIVGGIVYVAASVLILIEFRIFPELAPWVMGGLAIYGVWMILVSAFPTEDTTALARGLGFAVGVGFILLFISVLAIGTMDPTSPAPSDSNPVMVIVQFVGGGIAYLGFPVWLFLLTRHLR